MGKGYVYRCPKCGHEEELLSGVGFMSPMEADMEYSDGYLWPQGTSGPCSPS